MLSCPVASLALVRLDPRTGEVEEIHLPGLPLGRLY